MMKMADNFNVIFNFLLTWLKVVKIFRKWQKGSKYFEGSFRKAKFKKMAGK